jgi:hypothetical protein
MDAEKSLAQTELERLTKEAAQHPGVADLMAVYDLYRALERAAAPAVAAQRGTRISSVSDGAYIALRRS